MTTRLRLAASLEQLTDLCLNLSERLSELVLEDPADPQPEVKKEEAGASSSGLRPEDKGKEKVEEDWKPVPEFPKALSTETQPSFKQVVVEGSQSVLVTPVMLTVLPLLAFEHPLLFANPASDLALILGLG